MNKNDVLDRLRAVCDDAGGQSLWAVANGFSPQFISDVLNDRRPLSLRLLAALDLEISYEPVKK